MSTQLRPIPLELLTDSAVLGTPTEAGRSSEELDNVRIIKTGILTEYISGKEKDYTQIVMYFDCVNSSPADTEFFAGQTLSCGSEEYEIIKTELFAGEAPHHWRITARKVEDI